MRPVHLSDLHFAACAVQHLPRKMQITRLQTALDHADTADRYRKRLRRAHPVYGTGTLTSALGDIGASTTCTHPAYLEAMAVVARLLSDRAAGRK